MRRSPIAARMWSSIICSVVILVDVFQILLLVVRYTFSVKSLTVTPDDFLRDSVAPSGAQNAVQHQPRVRTIDVEHPAEYPCLAAAVLAPLRAPHVHAAAILDRL